MTRKAKELKGRRFRPRPNGNGQAPASLERAFAFLEMNRRSEKPRLAGLTEIRGPYYTPMGRRYLEDVLETMGEYGDSLKFAGGSFALFAPGRFRRPRHLRRSQTPPSA